MKKETTKKALALSRETVRVLDERKLSGIAGGDPKDTTPSETSSAWPGTRGCCWCV